MSNEYSPCNEPDIPNIGNTTDSSSAQPSEDDNIACFSDCAPYQPDCMKETSDIYTKITFTNTTDSYGRIMYRFYESSTTPLVLVIFKNGNQTLVSVNQYVLPLKMFLSLSHMEFIKNTFATNETSDLRRQPIINKGSVKACVDIDSHQYVFEDTTIPLLMMAITVIHSKYNTFM
jgi:hypothetical protein